MENLDLSGLFSDIYREKKVLLTGHTGFKGSWLLYWLVSMGAEVKGISLKPATDPAHIDLVSINYTEEIIDISEKDKLEKAILDFKPDIIFHLAAQALVRQSYLNPLETYKTNVTGTANILEIARQCANLNAIIIVTSDKCYDNKEWIWGYRENDPMGGKDPYSSSKACAELVTAAYRHSFFNLSDYGSKHNTLVATARAGNVIGGGDWATDRIIPDIARAASKKEKLFLRFPFATRPWQHVLEPLSGYLLLGWKLLEGQSEYADAWNFGPDIQNNVTVIDLVKDAIKYWPAVGYEISTGNFPHEAAYLMLDSSKAKKKLQWYTVWNYSQTVKYTIEWYKNFYETGSVSTVQDLKLFIKEARKQSLPWTKTVGQ